MTELLTAAQMRAIEQAAIASGEVTGLELMERAGRGVVEAILEEWPEMALTSQCAVVLCGPGNNGGDGFVVARLLRERGWEVQVFLYGDAEKLPPDAKVNCERWAKLGEVYPVREHVVPDEIKKLGYNDIVVDALFGTGLDRPLKGLGHLELELNNLAFFRSVEVDGPFVVSVDFPSGYCSDSGRCLDAENDVENHFAYRLRSHLTVTFHTPKVGHYLDICAEAVGVLVTKSIGLEKRGRFQQSIPIALTEFQSLNPSTSRSLAVSGLSAHILAKAEGHKYAHGHALILSGSAAQTGAARLAARGALRMGAGLVTIATPSSACHEHAAQLNAIMLREVDKDGELQLLLEDARINALCIGPALGLDDAAAELVAASLGAERNTVLDADALTLLARNPELFGKLHDKCVLTPHGGEFKRLFPDIAEKLEAPATKGLAYSKVDATREAAARAGCVVLFKGADTVIADPSGRCSINSAHYERAAPWLATAGSGDVLAGFITGLLARGFSPMAAAETGAWLHVECALKFGPGLIAEDLPEQLPAVFRDLGL